MQPPLHDAVVLPVEVVGVGGGIAGGVLLILLAKLAAEFIAVDTFGKLDRAFNADVRAFNADVAAFLALSK